MATGKTPKAPWVPAGIRLIATIWKPVDDPETAIKEADAARLAKAKYDQILGDPGVASALLRTVEDDDTAGAALVKAAPHVQKARKQGEKLRSGKADACGVRYARYYKIADQLCAETPNLKRRTNNYLAERVKEALEKQGEVVSPKTLRRAFSRRKYR